MADENGVPLQVLDKGVHNFNAGPDFLEASVKLGAIIWSGQIEIHVKASDWQSHGHSGNPDYENVILHVVWENDFALRRKDGTEIPALVLKGRVNEALLETYESLQQSRQAIFCSRFLDSVNEVYRTSWLDRALLNRLDRKGEKILSLYANTKSWEETAYQWLFMTFGMKVNQEPFLLLAQRIPFRILQKASHEQALMESLLLGMAGFLEEKSDNPYYRSLQRNFSFLAHKYGITEQRLERKVWRFHRIRPSNSPVVRLLQLASILFRMPTSLFNLLTQTKDLQRIREAFATTSHRFEELNRENPFPQLNRHYSTGRMFLNHLTVNFASPYLMCYGREKSNQAIVDRSVRFLEETIPEKNRIVQQWENAGVCAKNASDSQALIEQYNEFCLKKRCEECLVGQQLFAAKHAGEPSAH